MDNNSLIRKNVCQTIILKAFRFIVLTSLILFVPILKANDCFSKQSFLIKHKEVIKYANKLHKGQKRKFSGQSYIVHPIQVAKIVKQYSDDEDLLFAAYLHDTIEDTAASFMSLKVKFGKRIATLVDELTSKPEDRKKFKSKAEYLADKMTKMSSEALLIKLADRLHNTSDFDMADMAFITKYRAQTNYILSIVKNRTDLNKSHWDLMHKIYKSMHEGETRFFARKFAQKSYSGLFRKVSGDAYFTHPTRVAKTLETMGASVEIQTAAYLKDVVEKGNLINPLSEIKKQFGDNVANLVKELSNSNFLMSKFKGTYEYENLRVINMSREARLILLVSRWDNLKEIASTQSYNEFESYILAIKGMLKGLGQLRNISRQEYRVMRNIKKLLP